MSWLVKMTEEKEKVIRRRMWLKHHAKVILILLLKKIFHQKIHIHSGIAVRTVKISKAVEQSEVVKEVVLLKASIWTKASFLQKKTPLSVYSLSAITKTDKPTGNIFFKSYTSPRFTYNTILPYLQNNDHLQWWW